MKHNKRLYKSIVLYALILACIIFLIFKFSDAKSKYLGLQKDDFGNSEINIKMSSGDIKALSSNETQTYYREVKLIKDGEHIDIGIRYTNNSECPFEIKMEDEVYKCFKNTQKNEERFNYIECMYNMGIKTSKVEKKKMYFNEVDMGEFYVEKKIYDLVRNDDSSYFVVFDSDTENMRNIRYMIQNDKMNVLEEFNSEKLNKYTILTKLYDTENKTTDMMYRDIYYLYNTVEKKLEPFVTMRQEDNKSKEQSKLSQGLYELLIASQEYKTFVNNDSVRNLVKEVIDNRIEDIDAKYEELVKESTKKVVKKDDELCYESDGDWEIMKISQRSGFYLEEFKVSYELKDGYDVYYTLDGSIPTVNSIKYTQPIVVKDRSGQPDNLALISNTSIEWKKPQKPGFKGTVIRCCVFKDGKSVSDVKTNTYFVAPNMKEKYTFPVISLVTDKNNLFSYDEGIYVLGKSRSIWKRRNGGKKPSRGSYANYTRRGREWERPVYFEWFEPDGTEGFALNMGTRVNGGWSRSYPMKPLRFYARSEYDEQKKINYELFPGLKKKNSDETITSFKRVLLRNSGHDVVLTMFEDAMTQSLIKDITLDTQAYRPVIVFINGEYWGIHNLRERQDERYIQEHYDMNLDDFVILENRSGILHGDKQDKNHYRQMLEYIRTNDITNPKVYENLKTRMDVDNFINYYALQIWLVNLDWPGNNTKLWRKNTESYQPDSLYGHDGRWRWLLYDTEGGFRYYRYDMIEYMTREGQKTGLNAEWATFLFRTLLKNDEFKTAFLTRTADLMNTNLRPENVVNRIDEFQKMMAPEIQEHIYRWNTCGKDYEGWEHNVEILREFARNRPKFLMKNFCRRFNLSGTCTMTFSLNTENSCRIMINGYEVKPVDGVFSGKYFKGVKNEIKIIPNDGYEFISFDQDFKSTENLIHLSPSKDMNISINLKNK